MGYFLLIFSLHILLIGGNLAEYSEDAVFCLNSIS